MSDELHTPTPWRAYDPKNGPISIQCDAYTIAVMGNIRDAENARLIVRAVNSHAALVEALRLAGDCLSVADPEREHPSVERARELARAALATLSSEEQAP